MDELSALPNEQLMCKLREYEVSLAATQPRQHVKKRLYKSRIVYIRNLVAERNRGLVFDQLSSWLGVTEYVREELLSEGFLALTRSLNQYDPYKGFKFSTYAVTNIRRQMYNFYLRWNRQSRTMNQLEVVGPSGDLFDRSDVDDSVDVYRRDLVIELGGIIGKMISNGDTRLLSEKEKLVMRMRFLDKRVDGKRYTLDQVGKVLSLTRERVRQIQAEALKKLKIELLSTKGVRPIK